MRFIIMKKLISRFWFTLFFSIFLPFFNIGSISAYAVSEENNIKISEQEILKPANEFKNESKLVLELLNYLDRREAHLIENVKHSQHEIEYFMNFLQVVVILVGFIAFTLTFFGIKRWKVLEEEIQKKASKIAKEKVREEMTDDINTQIEKITRSIAKEEIYPQLKRSMAYLDNIKEVDFSLKYEKFNRALEFCEKAISEIKNSLEMFPESREKFDIRHLVILLRKKAIILAKQKQFKEAFKVFDDVFNELEKSNIKNKEKDYNFYLILVNKAFALFRSGEAKESLKIYNKIINDNKGDSVAYINRCAIYARDKSTFELASQDFKKALELNYERMKNEVEDDKYGDFIDFKEDKRYLEALLKYKKGIK